MTDGEGCRVNDAPVRGNEVLLANQALREWSAGLRHWSRCSRDESSSHRQRAQALRKREAPLARTAGAPLRELEPCVEVEPELPTLADVDIDELRTILTTCHGFGVDEAASAVVLGLLAAGYPSRCQSVVTADAFDVIETAVRNRFRH